MGIYQHDPNAEVADDYDNAKVQVIVLWALWVLRFSGS